MDAQELVEKHNAGERDVGSAYLVRADLSGAVLSEANLSKANLIEANLSGADLRPQWRGGHLGAERAAGGAGAAGAGAALPETG